MHGWDASVHPSAGDPADDVVRKEGAAEDLSQDPGAAEAGGGRGTDDQLVIKGEKASSSSGETHSFMAPESPSK